MTFQNREDKHHSSDSYDLSLKDLNKDYSTRTVRTETRKGHEVQLVSTKGGFVVYADEKVAAVLHAGTLYYSKWYANLIPEGYFREKDDWVRLEAAQRKEVKYPQDYLPLIDNTAKDNLKEFPILHQQTLLNGLPYEVRFASPPKKDAGTTIGILNGSYEVVAQASDEWGATLLVVAREYRGKGLGKLLAKVWHDWNPAWTSGGFTPAGEASTKAYWEDRVREFLANGWYDQLVKSGKLSMPEVKKILRGIGVGRLPKEEQKPAVKSGTPLVMLEEGQGFYVYDKAFYEDQDEKYIYAYGFFRDSDPVGTFLFRLDYESPYKKMATYIALQMAKNEKEPIYVGEGYGDTVEYEGLPDVVRKGDYIHLTKNRLDLGLLARAEKAIRRKLDPYQEVKYSLQEMADSKWS